MRSSFQKQLILLLTLDFYFLNYKRYQFLICLKGFLKLKIEQCINGLF